MGSFYRIKPTEVEGQYPKGMYLGDLEKKKTILSAAIVMILYVLKSKVSSKFKRK